MWQHLVGMIDFDEPLSQLLEQGWGFREYPPIVGALNGGNWAVIGVHLGGQVWADGPERKEAWAEAVRLALQEASSYGTNVCQPDDPTVFEEEFVRMRNAGWAFSEHQTVQENGVVGWVVSGSRDTLNIRSEHRDRSEAWGQTLILASVLWSTAPEESQCLIPT